MRRCSAGTCRTKRFDWPVLRDNVLAEVGRLEGAYTETLTNHDVDDLPRARRRSPGPIRSGWPSGKEVTADKILIATGARPVMPHDRGHRACDQLERGVPPRRAAEADRDRRRRLYRQRIRRHLPPVRKPRDPGQPHRRDPARTTTSRSSTGCSRSRCARASTSGSTRRSSGSSSATTARCTSRMTGCDDIEADAAAVRDRPQARTPKGSGSRRRASSSATRARSRSTPTTARRCRRSSRSATSPTASS